MKNTFYTVILVLLALLFSLVQKAQGQSMPLLTDPIKVRELELMSIKMDMTKSQQEAIIEVYDRYLEDFARTRLAEIKDFEDAIASAAETFGFMRFNIPERSLVEELVRKVKRAMKAIHRSDNMFLEEVSGMLTEKQRVVLNRIRIARELEAYEIFIPQLLGQLNRGARSQLRTLFERLHAESNVEIEGVLDTYDQRYLKEVKAGFDAVVETIELALDQIDELDIRGMDQQALMMRFMADESAIEDLKRRGDILLKPLVDQAYEISQINWKTWKKLDSILEEENARKLQQSYFSRSFYDAVRGGKKIEKYVERALALKELREDQKIDLSELLYSFRTKWKKKTGLHAEVLEKSRKVQTIAILSGGVVTDFVAKLDTLEKNREDYIKTTESRINGILGKQLVAKLKGEEKKHEELLFSESVVVSTDDSSIEVSVTEKVEVKGNEEEGTQLYGGATIPEPISPSFPKRASVILGLDESGEIIIDAVYEEYREDYTNAKKDLSNISSAIQKDEELSKGLRIRKIREITDNAADNVSILDGVFFDNLAIITKLDRDDVNLKMLEDHRQRQRTAAPEDIFGWRGGEGDVIDLVSLYVMSKDSDELHEGISPESRKAILASMHGYHQQVSNAHGDFVKAKYNMNHLQDAIWLMEESKQDDRAVEQVQGRWRDAFTDVRNTKRVLMLINQNIMDAMLKSVPETDFWNVRMAFVKKAYPDVFKKNSDVTTMLTAANAISNLDAVQKSQVESLASTYRYDYWNLCEQMIENHQSNAVAKSGDEMMNKEDIHRQLRLETLRFERKELNDRIQMQLRMVLNEDQIKDVPGLRPTVAAIND